MLNWPDYFMGFALHAARKSKDETQVGAVLLSPDGRDIILTAFNGPPAGVQDLPERRQRPMKYLYVAHAEANLISKAARYGIRTEGAAVYVTHAPCDRCATALIQAGIDCIVYGPGKTRMPQEQFDAAQVMFREAQVVCEAIDDDGAGITETVEEGLTRPGLALESGGVWGYVKWYTRRLLGTRTE